MPERDAGFRIYLKAFFEDTLTGMSGPLSVPFAVLALFVSSHGQKSLYASLTVFCAVFASYRVWRKDRMDSTQQIEVLKTQLSALLNRKPALQVSLTIQGEAPSQVLKLAANREVAVSKIEYMLSTGVCIVTEELCLRGHEIEIPMHDNSVLALWNTPRQDRNNWDHSGPAQLGITISDEGHSRQYVLPVQMQSRALTNVSTRKLVGSRTFHE
jgi:hypothetical protein